MNTDTLIYIGITLLAGLSFAYIIFLVKERSTVRYQIINAQDYTITTAQAIPNNQVQTQPAKLSFSTPPVSTAEKLSFKPAETKEKLQFTPPITGLVIAAPPLGTESVPLENYLNRLIAGKNITI